MKRAWMILRGRTQGSSKSSESLGGNEPQPEGLSRAGLRIKLARSPQRAALQEQMKELRQQVEKQQQQLEELQQYLSQCLPETEGVLGEAVMEILQTLQEIKSNQSECQKENQRLSEQLSMLREKNQALYEERVRLLNEKDLSARKYDEMKLEYQDKICRGKETLSQEVRQRESRIKELEKELSASKLQVEKGKELIAQITAENEKLLQERRQLLQKIADVEETSWCKRSMTAPLQSRQHLEGKKLQQELREAQRKAEWHAQVLQKEQEREEAPRKAAVGAQAQLAVLQNENLSVRNRLVDTKNKTTQEDLRTMRRLQNELEDKTRNLKAAESLLLKYQDLISYLNEENTSLQEELCKAMAEVHRTSAQLKPEKSSQLKPTEQDVGKGRGLRKKSGEANKGPAEASARSSRELLGRPCRRQAETTRAEGSGPGENSDRESSSSSSSAIVPKIRAVLDTHCWSPSDWSD